MRIRSFGLLVLPVCVLGALAVTAVAVGAKRLASPIDGDGMVETTAVSTLMDTGESIRADIRRVVAPAIERTQKLARDPVVIEALSHGTAQAQFDICNKAISMSTEIDAIALFNADGKIVAINTIYASGKPIAPERVSRIIGTNFDHRDIIQKCVRNDAKTSLLEFQTTCDITPAFFDSTGLSVAYSTPVIDPGNGHQVGIVSSRLRFERLFDVIRDRAIGGNRGLIQFVTDQGGYFSEKINSGREKPPINQKVLEGIVTPLVKDNVDYSFTHQEGEYVSLFRLKDFSTLSGGGIQVMLLVKEDWLAKEARRSRSLHVGTSFAIGLLLLLVAGSLPVFASIKKLQRTTAESAQRLDMALDAGGLGSWDWEVKTDTVTFDERFARQLGLKPSELHTTREEWLGRLHPDDATKAMDILREHLAGRTSAYANEFRVRHADGSYRWFYGRGKVVERAADGSPLRIVGTHTDISDRKVSEAALDQALKLESLGQLAAGVAHEVNTPAQYVGDNTAFVRDNIASLFLALDRIEPLIRAHEAGIPISTQLEELKTLYQELDVDFLKSEIPKALDHAIDGLASVSKIVRAMKDFSHPGVGEKVPVDLNAAIDSTATVCRNRWKYIADLEMDLDPELPHVPALSGELNQVILNLIINAADAIEDMGAGLNSIGRIKVSTRRVNDLVELRIQDNGPGIPEHLQYRIFEPFFTTKPVGKGTGQGLTISRNVIVKKHGGELTFDSKPGMTTFVIRLPLVEKTQRVIDERPQQQEAA